jgi:hypothetical protein
MIVFKILGSKHPIPTCWADVTYSQYVALIRSSSLTDHISIFTGIPRETLEASEIRNLEKISIALSFLSISPHFDRTELVGLYHVPTDVTIQSLGQFEDLRGLLAKMPREVATLEDNELIADLYLSACAIYCQKVRDGKYDYTKVSQVKDEISQYSCAEVIGTGAFFLFRPLNISPPLTSRFRKFFRHLRRLIQALPGYRKTLDFLQRSSVSPGR